MPFFSHPTCYAHSFTNMIPNDCHKTSSDSHVTIMAVVAKWFLGWLVTLGAHAQRGLRWLGCLSVCHISPLEHLFVLKLMSRTQRATKVTKIVGFSLKLLCCGGPALWPYVHFHAHGVILMSMRMTMSYDSVHNIQQSLEIMLICTQHVAWLRNVQRVHFLFS